MPQVSDTADLDMAACRTLLRGGSKSFDAAAKLLPRVVREPAIAMYAFCREADDVIDGGSGSLDWLRERLALAYQGRPIALPADRAFARVVERFAIPRALPDALLEGFAWDHQGRRYQTIAELRAYAVRVAGSVGAMMAVVMGVRDPDRLAAAIDLGVAMQLSNIARDVGEDARGGRLYLPLDWLDEAGIDPEAFLREPSHCPALGGVVGRLLQVAARHYRHAGAGIDRLPFGCRFGIGAAAALYAEIGHEVGRRGMDSVSGRAVVSARRKAAVVAKGLPGMALPQAKLSIGKRSMGKLAPAYAPEGAFLVHAVAGSASYPASIDRPAAWWDVAEKLRWTVALFERLEQRERVRPQSPGSIA